MDHFDVVIVGAGLSGIGAGVRLATMCPTKSFAILEGRESMGGTWDLFRYPGVRSDSDMFTLGYPFRPWKQARAIADGPSILRYIQETATSFEIDTCIRYDRHVNGASWSSTTNRWTIDAVVGATGETAQCTASFLYLCSGYYNYERGYLPPFPGADHFAGPIVHPQHWPAELDYQGKRVVIIGSGATAVTLAPALAGAAAQVTLLQRSPSYILSLPAVDPLAETLRQALPERVAHPILRWKNVLIGTAFYQLCRRRPHLARRLLLAGAAKQLPAGYDLDSHFSPRYDPWDQRLCIVPDGDLFKAIRSGRVSMVTDGIETFTPEGIRLASGQVLAADLVVAATGLDLIACGGITFRVDGTDVDPGQTVIYRGFMLSDLPNLALCFGYTNASWTLRADLTSRSVCQLINRMDRQGHRRAVPRLTATGQSSRPLLDLSSGYVARAADRLPKQGERMPWRLRQNYILDRFSATFGNVATSLWFSSAEADPGPESPVSGGWQPAVDRSN
jgi:monooxygenase